MCAHNGCPRPKATPDPYGLSLCHHHNTQFADGTIGQDHNPSRRQYPSADAAAILTEANNRFFNGQASIRQLADFLGLTKDACHHIQRQKWKFVRSAVWEQLNDGYAQQLFNQNYLKQNKKRKETTSKQNANNKQTQTLTAA